MTDIDRTKFIGGSDLAALLGIAPPTWSRNSPVALWLDKTTPREQSEQPARGVLRRGKRWEAAVAEMLVEELVRQGHAVEIVRSNQRYTDPTIPYFACEIDFEIRLDGSPDITNVELKTVHPFKTREWGESETDDAPIYYIAQAMWGLGITGRDNCIIAPLFGADEIRVFPIARDSETIKALRTRAEEFWTNHVIPLVPPPATVPGDIDLIFPEERAGSLLASPELTEHVLRLRAIDREIKAREAEYDALEFAIKREMGEHSELLVGDEKSAVTWKARPFSYLDQAAFKEAHPKLHKEFMKKGSSRVFTLKQFGWKD